MRQREYLYCVIVCLLARWRQEADIQSLFSKERNLLPKVIMRSSVPLPCFLDIVKSQKVAGRRAQQGTKSRRRGGNSVRLSAHQSFGWSTHPLFKGQLKGSKGLQEGSEGLPEGSEGLQGGPGGGDGCTYGCTDGRTEFLPILQDFVPCRGRCPATL